MTISGTLSTLLSSHGSVSVEVNGVWQTATVDASGLDWSLSTSLVAGVYDVIVSAAGSSAGRNSSAVQQVQVQVDGSAEPLSTITQIGPHASSTSTSFITSSAQLTLAGTLSAKLATGQEVQISLDGGQTWQSVPAVDVSGTHWHYDSSTSLADGSYTVETRVYDTASSQAGSVTISSKTAVVDTTAPTETVAITATSNGHTVTGSLSEALNLNGGSTESLQISIDNGRHWQTLPTSDVSDTSWTYTTTSNTLTSGIHAVEARVVDVAGNVGPVSTAAVATVGTGGTLDLTLSEILSVAKATGTPVEISVGLDATTVSLSEGLGSGARQWQETGTTTVDGVTYDVYHNASMGTSTAADLLVQAGIAVA